MVKASLKAPVSADGGMRILVVGDVHADLAWAVVLAGMAVSNGCDRILQTGDMGIFPHLDWGESYLDGLEQVLSILGVHWYFVDGNHDNHVWLRALPGKPPFVAVSPHITYLPRGARWEWVGTSFLALGGGYSLDKNDRKKDIDWWPQELLTYAEAKRAGARGHADIVVSHDVPYGVEGCRNPYRDDKDIFPESLQNRKLVRMVVDQVKPNVLYHGHYHWQYRDRLVGRDYRTEIHGLAHNRYPGSFEVLELKSDGEDIGE